MKHYLVLAVISSAILIPAIFTGTASASDRGDNGAICTPINQMDISAAQQAFSVELARLVAERNVAIGLAQSLTGTTMTDALIAADTRFRIGINNALNTLRLASQMSGSGSCIRVEDRHDNNRMENNNNQRGRDTNRGRGRGGRY